MDDMNVCPTEEAIQAFLEYLVDPILSPKSSMRDTPSLSQQESVAKQVHAVVLLYNYYHRKQCPKLEDLNFDSFCKLVLFLKPALMVYMKFMQSPNDAKLDDLEKQLSVTEKAIVDACSMSLSLDALKDVPNTEGWPISKVTVLLVDSKKENCFLLFNSITQGVWSVIEKDLDVSVHSPEDKAVEKHVHKNKRVTGKPSRRESTIDEPTLRKLAYSAVSEATGINQSDLLLLERHFVFSVSSKKAAACFFIIQCTKTVSEGIIPVPIKDVIDSLQGPLVQKSFGSWAVTPVVEYFHVLPYAGTLLDWYPRRELSNGLQDSSLGDGNIILNSCERIGRPSKQELHESQDKSPVNDVMIENLENNTSVSKPNPQSFKEKDTTGCSKKSLVDAFNGPQKMEAGDTFMVPPQNDQSCKKISSTTQVIDHHVENLENKTIRYKPQPRKQKDTAGCCKTSLANSLNEPQKVVMDDPSMVPSQNGQHCKNTSSAIQVVNHQGKRTSSTKSELHGSASNAKVEVVNSKTGPFITDCGVENLVSGKEICTINAFDQNGFVTCQSGSQDLEKLQIAIASKGNILSQTALGVLMKRRDDLSLQQRKLEDEIARCDKKIQTILYGGEDDLALKVDSIIEACNDVYATSERNSRLREDQCSPQNVKRKRLSEAILSVKNPCQELDGACYDNNWILPTYRVSPSDGGFQADVTVKGMDFECSSVGGLCSNPREARESAAAQVLAKLRSTAGQAQKF
ncbi:hypothetical protein D8674_025113 [Pyrus ussuriensis x Pyrus communis]|uniref:DRBM domain-containing protein n=1 Tax=Pyrus ussuriensis x Pyrus communis TaxID=2448454 RepID=A0A5N5H9S8_9ROSA|nr:hypothetical protein D8674_025113 [Pyrus ussuriensis x Pyrus communis]